jgi:hypothetical protein
MSRPIRKFIAFSSPLLLGIPLVHKSWKEFARCDSLSGWIVRVELAERWHVVVNPVVARRRRSNLPREICGMSRIRD